MKNHLKVLFAVVFLFLTGPPLNAQDISSGLVAHYQFGGNSIDAGPHGYHLTNSGAVLTFDRFGNSNSAYYFDGSSHLSVDPVNDTSFSNSNITFSSWVNLSSAATGSPGDWRIVAIGKQNTHWQHCILGIAKNTSTPLWFGTDGVSTYTYIHTANSALTPGIWYQVTCVADLTKDTTYIYINGVLESKIHTSLSSFSISNVNETIMIGASVGVSGDNLEGSLDDVRIYKRALTPADVAELYLQDTITNPELAIPDRDKQSQAEITMYPNPAGTFLDINGNFVADRIDLILSDGRLWKSLYNVSLPAKVSLAELPEGICLIRVSYDNGRILNNKIRVKR